ncbi:MAG: hypothetical protein QNJ46_27775 [Leptolyngbyaceae cyanobacterium MO_188.B28]|nr:hypothetical protein [Leptolyngbyaceae cyanobacterium MO_188.B28]
MSVLNLLAVSNPSDYWRSGPVILPWRPIAQQFHISSQELLLSDLRDRTHTPLLAQVDSVDPGDPSRDVLTFFLDRTIPPSLDDSITSGFIRVASGQPMPQSLGEASVEVIHGTDGRARGVRLVNNRLIVWINLIPAPENDRRDWYAGSATSIQLDRQEMLDPFRAAAGEWMGQDPEKRCLQISQLQLPGPPHPTQPPCYEVSLFNHPYRLVSQSSGLVRARITLASEPFDYMGPDPITGNNRHLICELYRVISLYARANYLVEELFVKGKPKGEEDRAFGGAEAVNPNFSAHYFTHMNLGPQPHLYQPPHAPGWFAIGSVATPYPGYGFATDVNVETVEYPHGGHENCIAWRLLPGKSAKCLHLFMRCPQQDFEAQIGKAWYELIYKPIQAGIYEDEISAVSLPESHLVSA